MKDTRRKNAAPTTHQSSDLTGSVELHMTVQCMDELILIRGKGSPRVTENAESLDQHFLLNHNRKHVYNVLL